MRQSIGYTVTLNIIIIFITIIFFFLCATIIYYKSNKVNNIIINSIEKYEGYNNLARLEISNNIKSLGYNSNNIKCDSLIETNKDYCLIAGTNLDIPEVDCEGSVFCEIVVAIARALAENAGSVPLSADQVRNGAMDAKGGNEIANSMSENNDGYCVYLCALKEQPIENPEDDYYFYYKVKTNMLFNVPIINSVLNLPVYSNTNKMYNFDLKFQDVD